MAATRPILSDDAPAKPGTITPALQQEALWVIEWAEHELTNRLELDEEWDASERRTFKRELNRLRNLRDKISGRLTATDSSLLDEACSYAAATFATHETVPHADKNELAANKQRLAAFEQQLGADSPQQTL